MGQALLDYLALFTSFGTLLCCALPALFVTLGMGVVVAGVTSHFYPLLILTRNKNIVFIISAVVLLVDFYLVYFYRSRSQLTCSLNARNICERVSRWNRFVLWLSAAFYGAGFFMSYLIVPLLKLLRLA